MATKKKRGPGRKPKERSGELLKQRSIRMSDACWAAFQYLGLDRVRALIKNKAARMKRRAEFLGADQRMRSHLHGLPDDRIGGGND
jgi:hypothetical protein